MTLAIVGNYASLGSVAMLGFVVGYTVFFIGRFPECVLSPGAADGRIYNSHVLWHIMASLSQLRYVMKTFGV